MGFRWPTSRSNSAPLKFSRPTRTSVWSFPKRWDIGSKRILLGRPYVTEQLSGERLSNPVALGVLAPDCISSSAYGAEQILTQLTPFIGLAAFSLVVPIMFVIIGVLFLVTLSYLDVIGYYTTAGGSYVVARDNFGPKVAQIAAVALLLDYIVTVAVQCSAGTATLTSAVPSLTRYTVPITVGIVLLLIYGNLRGIREAGRLFALPTYLFIFLLGSTIIVGLYQVANHSLALIPQPPVDLLVDGKLGHGTSGLLMGVAFLTLLRAYANGGSSLTGLEAISNGVASFRRPESPNARRTLVTMSAILAFLLLGTTFLARFTHALPYAKGTPTVVAQEVQAVFGYHGLGHIISLCVLASTVLILYTGGNTSFNGFPFLANYVATDRYLPRQLTKRGHRLAFSNGIIVLGIVALALILVFEAQVNGLISLYAIGVFTGFFMAGSGMVKRHWTRRRGQVAPRHRRERPLGLCHVVGCGDFRRGEVHRGRLDCCGRRADFLLHAAATQPSVRTRRSSLRGQSGRTGRTDPLHPGHRARGSVRPGHRTRPRVRPDAQRLFHPCRPLRHRPRGHAQVGARLGRGRLGVVGHQSRSR
jgi:amino acid transporter